MRVQFNFYNRLIVVYANASVSRRLDYARTASSTFPVFSLDCSRLLSIAFFLRSRYRRHSADEKILTQWRLIQSTIPRLSRTRAVRGFWQTVVRTIRARSIAFDARAFDREDRSIVVTRVQSVLINNIRRGVGISRQRSASGGWNAWNHEKVKRGEKESALSLSLSLSLSARTGTRPVTLWPLAARSYGFLARAQWPALRAR